MGTKYKGNGHDFGPWLVFAIGHHRYSHNNDQYWYRLKESGQKYGFQRQHFPCEFRADLYVFGIRGTRRMGAASELIQNQTF